jgi:hypothetical protein
MANLGMHKPFNKSTGRDYKDEYARYQGTSEQKLNRAKRNGARAEMAKAGKVKKGDGKDVDHKKAMKNGGTNSKGNLRVLPKSKNRGFPRDSKNSPTGAA